jgi:O-antigen ligase
MMALGVVVFLLLAKAEPERRWRIRLGLLASLILLVLSHSVTAYVVTAVMFILLPLCGILRKSLGKALAGMGLTAVCGTAALFWVFTHFATFTDALGKSVTLSGRLQLWALCVVMALQKPWLGYGFSAFWLGMHGPSYRIWLAMGVEMPHAHNGFIQIWLDLGLAGLALLVLVLLVYTIRAGLLIRRTTQPEAVWPLMLFAFLFLFMLTGVPIPSDNSLFMMIFSSCVFATAMPIRDTAAEFSSVLSNGRRHTAAATGTGSVADLGSPA